LSASGALDAKSSDYNGACGRRTGDRAQHPIIGRKFLLTSAAYGKTRPVVPDLTRIKVGCGASGIFIADDQPGAVT
jgi:hypothetical protein